MRSEIRQLLAANDLDHIPDRLRWYDVDTTTVKRLMSSLQLFPRDHYREDDAAHAEIDDPFTLRLLSLRDSFIWRILLGCEPPTQLRDYATERLRELQKINVEISMEPITPREVDQIIDALIAFVGLPARGPYPDRRAGRNDRDTSS